MPENTSRQTRVEWIDVAKGVGILSVMLLHSIIPNVNFVTTILSSFTIPLFFVIAGLTYNPSRYRYNLSIFAKTRGKQFLIPYFCLQTATVILFYIFPTAVETQLTPDELLFWFLYGSGPPNQSTHLWFLPVLYFSLLLFAIIDRLVAEKTRTIRFFLIPVFVLLAMLIIQWFSPMLVPWHVGSIFMACAFTIIGNEMRKKGGTTAWKTNSPFKDLVILAGAILTLVFLSETNGFTDIAVDNIGCSAFIYLATGTLGTIVVFRIASYLAAIPIRVRQIFVTLGNASQEVYEFHPLTFLLVVPIMLLVGWSPSDIKAGYDLLWPLRFLLAIMISVPIVLFGIRRNRILSFIFTGTPNRRNRENFLKSTTVLEASRQM